MIQAIEEATNYLISITPKLTYSLEAPNHHTEITGRHQRQIIETEQYTTRPQNHDATVRLATITKVPTKNNRRKVGSTVSPGRLTGIATPKSSDQNDEALMRNNFSLRARRSYTRLLSKRMHKAFFIQDYIYNGFSNNI